MCPLSAKGWPNIRVSGNPLAHPPEGNPPRSSPSARRTLGMPKGSTYQKERFLRLCRHYVVAAPGSPTMTKAFFEAHLIGLALQSRQPEPGPSLGNGQWAKELLIELLPTFKWSFPKAAATKATTNAIAFVNKPVLRDDGTPEAEQHRFILEFLHVESSTLTHEQVVRIRHLGSHHLEAMRLHKGEVRTGRGSSSAGGPSSSASHAVAGGRIGGDAIPPGVRHMASLIEVDSEPQRQGERSWLAPHPNTTRTRTRTRTRTPTPTPTPNPTPTPTLTLPFPQTLTLTVTLAR